MLLILIGTSIATLKSLLSHASALFWNYKNYGLVYVIDINKHVLLFCLYYFFVPIALLWNTGREFNQCSYYCYLFSLGTAYRIWHRYCQVWVRYLKTTNTTVYCMSALLIQMYNSSFYIISSFHSRCSEPQVVGLINTVIIVTYFTCGQHSFFDIVIITCECAVAKIRTLRSIVCQCY